MPSTCNPLIPYGGAEGDRTPGLLNAIQALSQLSYSPVSVKKRTPFSIRILALSIQFS